MKKHQILEADVMAHDDRIKDLNENGNVLVEGDMFDSNSIRFVGALHRVSKTQMEPVTVIPS